jgi:UDP-N-acetylenolpyruvoylglucosamine reductase
MEGIPGNLGGAVRMNAGAMGIETSDQIVSVRYLDTYGSTKEKPLAEIAHQYRSVPEFEERYVLSARLRGVPTDQASIDAGLEASRVKRRSTQPIGASAGCCFKNPALCGAGKLVDELGLKGLRVGNAVVSQVHGNFIVNEGKASARDVLDLTAQIQEIALRERGIQLELEVKVIGEDAALPL